MKKLLILAFLFFITSCTAGNKKPNTPLIENIECIQPYSETRRGISIITLKDGNRFLYAETPDGVAMTQITECEQHTSLDQ